MMSNSHRPVEITAVILLIIILLCWGMIAVGMKLTDRLTNQETAVTATVEIEAEDQYPGLMITAVILNSPAAQAGLKPGHIILSANDVPTNHVQQLLDVVNGQASGNRISLIVIADGEQKQAMVTRGEERPFLGIDIIENSSDAANYLKTVTPTPLPTLEPISTPEPIPFEPVIVGRVLPNTPAEEIELAVGDVLTAVDGAAILNSAELLAHIANKSAGDSITLTFRRGSDTLTRSVTLISHPENDSGGFLGVELQSTP